MKRVAIKLLGKEGEPEDVAVNPGTTPADIFRDLNLSDYHLSKGSEGKVFGEDENIYPLIEDGSKLYATTKCELGQ